jgi:hypothetical protein
LVVPRSIPIVLPIRPFSFAAYRSNRKKSECEYGRSSPDGQCLRAALAPGSASQ